MHIAPWLAVATFLPFAFALVSLGIVWRVVKHRVLFLVAMTLSFSALHELAFRVVAPPRSSNGLDHTQVIEEATRDHFLADVVAGVLGGLLAWRLARALR